MSEERGPTMPALVFEFDLKKLALSKLRGLFSDSGYWKPGGAVGLQQVPAPALPADDWVIVKTVYAGICGSDMMELTLAGAADNPLRSFLTFPQTMGHELTGVVERTGPRGTRVKPGDRGALSPGLP